MDKRTVAVYAVGGVLILAVIVATAVIAVSMKNKPVNICTTLLTEDMAFSLLNGYCGIKEDEADRYLEKKETRDAYLELIDQKVDVVFASEADDDIMSWLKANNSEVETFLIAKDAIAFFNNINNKVDDLETSEVKGIFSGKNKNWSNVRGSDEDIIVYLPLSKSEEEYMMKKFMGNKAIAKSKYKLENSSLEGIIEAISKYLDTRTKSISYTTFRNIKNINNKDIRIIKVNGVEPSIETIKSGEYKAVSNIYAIIRKDSKENSQTRKFVEYITSKEGQIIIEQCGYANLMK